jgi:hypothetical protein
MRQLLADLKIKYPALNFLAGQHFYWSPETNQIFYKPGATDQKSSWSLLHETGHALLEHKSYTSDFNLLKLELEAWEKARDVAKEFNLKIDDDHIQDCLDTYRDWLYKRSICPTCSTKSLQQNDNIHYKCFNCHTVWKVSASRFCRAYRSTKAVVQPGFAATK